MKKILFLISIIAIFINLTGIQGICAEKESTPKAVQAVKSATKKTVKATKKGYNKTNKDNKVNELDELKIKLKQLVEEEKYEEAAVIRDKIRDIEGKKG